MTARAAYPMIYGIVTAGRTPDQVLEIDAILGDATAERELAAREQDVLESSGAVEFG